MSNDANGKLTASGCRSRVDAPVADVCERVKAKLVALETSGSRAKSRTRREPEKPADRRPNR